MRSVGEHLNLCLLAAAPLAELAVPLDDAVDCVLSVDVVAPADLPTQDLAGVDGYAVNRAVLSQLPVTLPVTAEVLAGDAPWASLVPGCAIKVASGAVLPAGADWVVPLFDTDMGISQVTVNSVDTTQGHHFIGRGSDVRRGEVLLRAGQRLDAKKIALLSALGMSRVRVHPKVRVVIVTVGDELVEPGSRLEVGQVADANGHSLAAACHESGAKTFRVMAPDDRAMLRETLEDQLVRADVILTTGGLSSGPADTVKEVLNNLGQMRFDNVAVAPGRQLGVGKIGEVPVFCLPGDPLAAQVAFETFIRPVLRKMAGRKRLYRESVQAVVDCAWDSPAQRRQFVPVELSGTEGNYRARVLGLGTVTAEEASQEVSPHVGLESGLGALARANAFAVVPESTIRVEAGTALHCMVLD